MITVQQHIKQAHGGNISAFARSVNASRPTVYRYIETGCLWHNGRVWDPVTAAPTVSASEAPQPATIKTELSDLLQKVFDNEAAFKSRFNISTDGENGFYMSSELCVVLGFDYSEMNEVRETIKTDDFLAWVGGLDK